MSSPVATIADALIAFILSLLRDPDAAEKFTDDPRGAMAENGVGGASLANVREVTPVIVDNPQVESRPPTSSASPSGAEPRDNAEPSEVVAEITRIMNQFTTVDARSTVVDQSVNQNIWTEGGDVTQLFDQEAVIASGDSAIAAGNDASTVDEDLDLTVGDVTVGNDTFTDSFDDADIDVDAGTPQPGVPEEAEPATVPEAPAAPDATEPDATEPDATEPGAAEPDATEPDATEPGAAEPAVIEPPQTPASLPEPADNLESDLTTASDDSFDAGTAAVPVDDVAIDVPVDE